MASSGAAVSSGAPLGYTLSFPEAASFWNRTRSIWWNSDKTLSPPGASFVAAVTSGASGTMYFRGAVSVGGRISVSGQGWKM